MKRTKSLHISLLVRSLQCFVQTKLRKVLHVRQTRQEKTCVTRRTLGANQGHHRSSDNFGEKNLGVTYMVVLGRGQAPPKCSMLCLVFFAYSSARSPDMRPACSRRCAHSLKMRAWRAETKRLLDCGQTRSKGEQTPRRGTGIQKSLRFLGKGYHTNTNDGRRA